MAESSEAANDNAESRLVNESFSNEVGALSNNRYSSAFSTVAAQTAHVSDSQNCEKKEILTTKSMDIQPIPSVFLFYLILIFFFNFRL